MQPIEFTGQNIVMGKRQPEYNPLPAHKGPDGTVTMCIELTEEEKAKVAQTGQVFIQVLTFNGPLQPMRFMIDQPELEPNPKLEAEIKAFEEKWEREQKLRDREEKRLARLNKKGVKTIHLKQ